MRVIRRLGRDSGAVGVLMAVMLLVLMGSLALSIDGGLLFVRYRGIRNANDAAALAAALSCAKGDGMVTADSQADSLAGLNASGAYRYEPYNVYESGCTTAAGTVVVHYAAQQPVYFGPAVGLSSPRDVRASATAIWGAATGATNIAPLMLSEGRLSSPGCDVPTAATGTHCFFWWDNGTGHDTTVLTQAEWGLMDLNQWDVDRYAACPGNVNQSDVTTWIRQGYPGVLMLNETPPTYVCRGNGFQGNALNNDVNFMVGQELIFPVNDPGQQVDSSGAICRPGDPCTVQKYAIVAFGVLQIVHVWTGQDAQDKCNHPAANNGSIRCLEAVWQGPLSSGVMPGSGPSFGVIAVGLES
jgi:hypothetical protein